ncbi:hypothetical protein [Inconstantimicrobium porci]|uniref:Uncharacterized protein n=1 Tax=Inconstantimicrobium porci TaxID=2652291 RepID=A0A7X2MYA9_9CLOT|nr:hypothetical protein [Inconstantimicrobium porci]MSR91324.1 hypothetical protein [Inconstantimicrobium porci]
MDEHKYLEMDILPVTEEYMQHNYVKTYKYELIEDIIMFCTIYPLIIILNCAVSTSTNLEYISLTLFPVMLMMSYMRIRINKRYLYDAGVLVLGMIYYIFSMMLPYKNLLGEVGVICVVVSIRRSKKKQNVKYNLSALVEHEILLIIFLIVAIIMKNRFIQGTILVCGLIIIVISCAYLCKARNVRLIMDDPKNETFRNRDSSMFAVEIAVLISVILIILQVTGVFAAANRMSNQIVNNIRQSSTVDYRNIPPKEANNNPKKIEGIDFSKLINPKKGKPSKIVIVLGYVISAVVTIVVAAIGIAIVYMLLNRLMINIKKLKNSDKVTFVFNEIGENEKKENEKRKNVISRRIFLSPRDKIRKIYKKKVKSYKKRGTIIKQNFTVNDIKREILDKTSNNIDYISNIYEKARYSNEEISKEELKLTKTNDHSLLFK